LIDRARLEDLILARLSVQGARPLSPTDLAKAVEVFLDREVRGTGARQEIADAIARLRDGGYVEPATLVLTNSGTERLCSALALPALPKARSWGDFKRKHLVRLFEKGPAAADPATLGLKLIARKLGLPDRSARSESALANAWMAKALGLEGDGLSPFRIRTACLAASLKIPARPRLEDVVRLSVTALSGARTAGPGDVAHAMVAHWLTEGSVMSGASPSVDASGPQGQGEPRLHAIQKVREAARSATVRRYGPSKVFIASVWEALRSDPEFSGLGETGFKNLLIAAHQRGDLTLARADLVAAMDPADVAASEIRHLNATYHFIQDNGDQS
jgi:hypothetical protein